LKGRASTLVSAGEAIELRHIERAMKLKIERRTLGAVGTGDAKVASRNTLVGRTLAALPGERFA
jgi:hypothetical protein